MSISGQAFTADEVAAYEAIAPALSERFLQDGDGKLAASLLATLFPSSTWFGMGVLVNGKLLLTGNLKEPGRVRLTAVPVDGVSNSSDVNGGTRASGTVSTPRYAALGDGSLLCVPLRQPPALDRVAQGEGSCNGSDGGVAAANRDAANVQDISCTRGVPTVSRRTTSTGVLVLAVASGQKLEGSLARLVAMSARLDPQVAAPEFQERVQALGSSGGSGSALRGPPADPRVVAAALEALAAGNMTQRHPDASPQKAGSNNSHNASGGAAAAAMAVPMGEGQLEARLLSLLQGLPVANTPSPLPPAQLARQQRGQGSPSNPSGQQQAGAGAGGGPSARAQPPPPCTSPEIQQLLSEILEAGGGYGDDVLFGGGAAAGGVSGTTTAASSSSSLSKAALVQHNGGRGPPASSSVLSTAHHQLQQQGPATIVLPGPDDVAGKVHLLRPEDRWFEQHWLWLNFRDPELEKRFNWWHNRQCVKLDSGFCWFSFTLLVVLLTVEPYSLAKYHSNAFPLAFLIVPGVYILHRWDTDWYIKRRHAVIMVQATYYMVYMVVFVTPVFLQVKSPASLRRPLWLLRISGVECMLMQLCFQVPFEKFFWMGVLHLGIVSSLQRAICERLYADVPPSRCTSALTGLQLLLGFGLTMLISRYLENWRRRSFLKHVRAERPDPKAVVQLPTGGGRSGRAGGRNARKALKEAARELEAAALPPPPSASATGAGAGRHGRGGSRT